MILKQLKYDSFSDKELGYFLRRKNSTCRMSYPINLIKFKSQRQGLEDCFPVVVRVKKGKRNPRATVRGRKNRNRVKRPLGISLQNIARNRCYSFYGFSNSTVSRGYKIYSDGSISWFEFVVRVNSTNFKNVIKNKES